MKLSFFQNPNQPSSITPAGKPRGELRLQLHLSTSVKPHDDVLLEHRRLLRVLLSHELLKRNSPPYSWKDGFCKETLAILAQHAVQGKMTRDETALTRWTVYCQTHAILQLDHRVFTPILDKLRKKLQSGGMTGAAATEFNDNADTFTAQCVVFIRRHRHYMHGTGLEKYHTQVL